MSRLFDRMAELDALRYPLHKMVALRIAGFAGAHIWRRRPKAAGPRLLNLGCGVTRYPGFVNADFYRRTRGGWPDWMLDAGKPWACPDDFWEGIFTEHMLEHLTYGQALTALRESLRTLVPGGWIRVVVPTLGRADAEDRALEISHVAQCYGHASVWDDWLLCETLRQVGFGDVSRVSYGQGSYAPIIQDQDARKDHSLYVEGRKPD